MVRSSVVFVLALAAGCSSGAIGADPPTDAGSDDTIGDARASADARPADAAPVTIVDPDGSGTGATWFPGGAPDPDLPFFTMLGTNQRTCATCHDRATGWTVSPAALQARFDATDGRDPIFRPIDGATSPTADTASVAARRTAYAMLLGKGLVRVGLPIPAGAEFTLAAVDDPYGFASAAQLSLFRRPLPTTNLPFEATIMWDGREPSLAHQAMDAALGHCQAEDANPDTMAVIAAFESTLYTAQATDSVAGDLAATGATGGPGSLPGLTFQVGMNDAFAAGYDPHVFNLFAAWTSLPGNTAQAQRQRSIAHGEALFNTRTFAIQGVAGLADQAAATCSTCHDTPGIGSHSLDELMNVGVDSSARRTSDLPLYTLRRTSDGSTVQTSDPGRALVTGKWADVGKFRIGSLRGLAARPPYFHNGSEPTLGSVVDYYNLRFSIGLTALEAADLAAFLAAL